MVTLLIIICVIASGAILLSVAAYNSVIRTDEQADAVEGRIRSLITKQADLVTHLAASARAYGAADGKTITEVEHRLREVGAAKETIARLAACDALTNATSTLIEEVKSSEEAMASTGFTDLITDTEGVVEEITAARTQFVECVDAYNNALAAFPASIICGPRFRPRTGGSSQSAE